MSLEFQHGEPQRNDVEIRQFDLEERKTHLTQMIDDFIAEGNFADAIKAVETMPLFLGQDSEKYSGFRDARLIDIVWEASSRGEEHMRWAERAAELLGSKRGETVGMLADHAQEIAHRLARLR